jgi:hypothetical protein
MKAYIFYISQCESIVLAPVPPKTDRPNPGCYYPAGGLLGNFGILKSKEPEMFDYLMRNYPIPKTVRTYIEVEI